MGHGVSGALDAADVFTGPGIHFENFTDGDEQGDVHHRTGGQCCRLGAALRRVPFHARVSLYHFQLDKVGGSHRQGRAVVERDGVDILLLEPFERITYGFGIGSMLLKGAVCGHEVPELSVRIEILHILVDHIRRFEALTGFEGAFPDPVGHQVAELHAVERLPFARFDELVFQNDAGIAIQQNLETAAEFIGRIRSHETLT